MINFMTFGSHDRYITLANNLIKSITQLNIFDKTILYTSDTLKKDTTFWNTHEQFIGKNIVLLLLKILCR